MRLSEKGLDFLLTEAEAEFLEGTTCSGKTVMAVLKFMLRVAESNKKLHILCGLDLGTAEKNLIHSDLGIMAMFGRYVRYMPAGGGSGSLPHILFQTGKGVKTVYVLGYGDKNRWKKALGGQYGCALVDESNVADMDFVRELFMRCDYVLATLNPDDPELELYREYVNRARGVDKWVFDTPDEILEELRGDAHEKWVHWYFRFGDNPGLSEEKRAQIAGSVAVGTKMHRNKVLGLRGRAEGAVFPIGERNIVSVAGARDNVFVRYACGVDTSYSIRTDDCMAMIFVGFTKDGKKIALAERVFNNRERGVAMTPGEMPECLCGFLRECEEQWGFARDVYIDSADAATLLECRRYKRRTGVLYRFGGAWKALRVMDRLHLEAGWLAAGVSLICEACPRLIAEVKGYQWTAEGFPPDKNDHCINAWQYAWLPFIRLIG